jgi:hypothetical protein
LGDAVIAFKPYACGTMTQPYIDCAIALVARGVVAGEIANVVCKVGEGTAPPMRRRRQRG